MSAIIAHLQRLGKKEYSSLMENKETIRMIEERYSVRNFRAEDVDEETVDKLKRLTLRAPSAGNMLYYTVIEVRDKEKKEKLARLCDNQGMIAKAPLVWLFLADNHKWECAFDFSHSPQKIGKVRRKSGYGDLHLTMQDAIIAAENCAIAAQALGLGSCYIGDVIENGEELTALFHLPPHAIPAALLIMGYPAEKRRGEATPRPDIASSIFMRDEYIPHTPASIKEQYANHDEWAREHKLLPDGNLETQADRLYKRKYTSPFMAEMNRSVEWYFKRYLEEQ